MGSLTDTAGDAGLVSSRRTRGLRPKDHAVQAATTTRQAPFVPEFLLRRWECAGSKVLRYSRNSIGETFAMPLSPAGMGYQRGLYPINGFPAEHRQQVEKLFMEPLDTAAAAAHGLLLEGKVDALTDEQRCRWGKPDHVALVPHARGGQRHWAAVDPLFDPATGKAVLGIDIPDDFPEATRRQLAMEVMMNAIGDGDRGADLINMHCKVIDSDRHEFLIWTRRSTSQRSSLGRPTRSPTSRCRSRRRSCSWPAIPRVSRLHSG